MLFRLHFHHRHRCRHLLVALASHDRVFYSAKDVGRALDHPQTEAFVREVACVRLGELFPAIESRWADEWVLNEFSLLQLLQGARSAFPDGPSVDAAVDLWCLLRFRNLECARESTEIPQLNECCQDEGQPLSAWTARFRRAPRSPPYPPPGESTSELERLLRGPSILEQLLRSGRSAKEKRSAVTMYRVSPKSRRLAADVKEDD